jgi:anti-sigma factor RsiW
MACDRAEQVHAYHDRELAPAARVAFEAHLADCAECARSLDDLRAVSRQIKSAPLAEITGSSLAHYYRAWHLSRQRGLLRIASWLTAAAAAALIGSLLLWPSRRTPEIAGGQATSTWEPVALMPPPERVSDRPDEFVELAQWMADDLSDVVR